MGVHSLVRWVPIDARGVVLCVAHARCDQLTGQHPVDRRSPEAQPVDEFAPGDKSLLDGQLIHRILYSAIQPKTIMGSSSQSDWKQLVRDHARPRARRHAASLWPRSPIDIAGHLAFLWRRAFRYSVARNERGQIMDTPVGPREQSESTDSAAQDSYDVSCWVRAGWPEFADRARAAGLTVAVWSANSSAVNVRLGLRSQQVPAASGHRGRRRPPCGRSPRPSPARFDPGVFARRDHYVTHWDDRAKPGGQGDRSRTVPGTPGSTAPAESLSPPATAHGSGSPRATRWPSPPAAPPLPDIPGISRGPALDEPQGDGSTVPARLASSAGAVSASKWPPPGGVSAPRSRCSLAAVPVATDGALCG